MTIPELCKIMCTFQNITPHYHPSGPAYEPVLDNPGYRYTSEYQEADDTIRATPQEQVDIAIWFMQLSPEKLWKMGLNPEKIASRYRKLQAKNHDHIAAYAKAIEQLSGKSLTELFNKS